ncbi:5-methyltetrahydrofolate--homocysteine methyltransferase [Desulfacinum infernum DSM 9756]|uniref:5-methyltetrahydrofolate--homocysteine methyltransferase n=1 Tax=Desulfacinum infernum DSM 9756 TaxID=1121391 RepID=A0A1M5BQD9_9BACT|nr:corrinoid protein [Desulfacinum infernum]SHF44754.1 5-methyltetrahydrofolate--homocysteine methyltransferase [Desulfacinum infernum DSM 9756]
MHELFQEIRSVIISGRPKEVEAPIQRAIEAGVPLDRLIHEAMIDAMDEVGRRFTAQEIFVPEMLASAMAMKKGLSLIKPLLTASQNVSRGTVLICTVKGDIHDIGKNLVVMMLEGAGFQVMDLGVDVTVEALVEKVRESRPQILGLSALLTTTMPEMKRVIETLEAEGLRDQVKVIVGGAPVDEAFALRIGADGYGADAAQAVALCKKLVEVA